MGMFDLFSKRNKALPDVYQYDVIPDKLRIQILHIVNDALLLKVQNEDGVNIVHRVYDILCREHGLLSLVEYTGHSKTEDLFRFFLQTEQARLALDTIELLFGQIDTYCRTHTIIHYRSRGLSPDDAISELNFRFRENGSGYQFSGGRILRIDSQFVHSEVVRPTITLIGDPKFKGVNDEFLNAHEHYRHERIEECITECLKAFESTLKTIFTIRRWPFDSKATASKLLEVAYEHELVPQFVQSQFGALRTMLESGVPTNRNRMSGHGQGPTVRDVPLHFAAYQLHLTASCILFLIESHQAKK